MEESKNKHNKLKIVNLSIIGILAVILVLWLLLQFAASYKNNKSSKDAVAEPTIIVPTDEPLVTPTIGPSSNSNWKTFIFSDSNTPYSFAYPSDWKVVEIAHDHIVRLNFAGHCRVEFSTIGRGDDKGVTDQTKESKTYANRTFDMTTLNKDNVPYSEIFSLSDATSKDGFSIINVDLPVSNVSQCQQTVDQILSSLKFGQ